MENNAENNRGVLSGMVQEAPVFSHSLYGEAFFSFPILVPRLSGAEDIVPGMASERLLPVLPEQGGALFWTGQLRSYNLQQDGANRLVVTFFARSVEEKDADAPCINEIMLAGFVCKPPVYRTTPFSREITDVLIAVNRPYHKSDYLPVIVWGRNARFASGLTVGNKILVQGRMQSRPYQKTLADGTVLLRVAYEVSAGMVELME